MSENGGSKVSYFLVGMGIGALLGILFAPKSGEETREYLGRRAEEGREFAQKKTREIRERADDFVDRGRELVEAQKDKISAAIDAGKEAYQREKSKN